MTMRAAVGRLVDVLPHGRSLPAGVWRARHQAITRATVTATLLVIGFCLVMGITWRQALSEAAFPALLVALAWYTRWPHRVRASLLTIALMGVAAIAVHASGTIEAHVLFLLAVPVVAFYEDWVPFIASVGMVLLHHLAVGLYDPSEIYNHEAARQAPLRWGLVHAGLLLTMCAISVVHWRMHERAHATLVRQALHDPLTGLANRTLLLDRLEHALEDRTRTHASVCVLTLDLDGFKPVNDTFGHQAGDHLLVAVASRLRATVRPGDTPARPGGDEFVVVLPGAGPEEALQIAQRIIDAISAPVTAGERLLTVGASAGVAAATTPADTVEGLLDRADEAMLTAKRNGRGTTALYHPQLDRSGSHSLLVSTAQATAWADYMAALRTEIGDRKASGDIPEQSRAPTSIYRTLNVLLTEINELPDDRTLAHLPLPERTSLAEFLFHQTMVHGWADGLVDNGILTTRRSQPADRFWSTLHNHITRPGRETPTAVTSKSPAVHPHAQ